MLGVGEVLGAEAAADIGGHEAHVLRLDTQAACHVIAVDMDVLAGDLQRVAAAGFIERAETAARLHRVGRDAVIVEAEAHDMARRCESGLGLRGVAGAPVEAAIAGYFGRQQGRTGRERRGRRRDGGQGFVVDLHQFGGVECLGLRLGHDQRHRLTGKACLVRGQQRLWRENERVAVLHIGLGVGAQRLQPVDSGLRRRQHGQHAGRAACGCCVDRPDPRMGMRRAQDDGPRQARHFQVIEIGALTGDKARIFSPPGRVSDPGRFHAGNVAWRQAPPQEPACALRTGLLSKSHGN